MRRWTASLFAALLVAMPLLADDKSADEKGNDREKQFKEIQADYRKAVPKVQKALQDAKTDKERDEILEKLNKDFAPRVLKLIESDPKDKQSFQMLQWCVFALPKGDPKVYEILVKDWAKDEKIQGLCEYFMSRPAPEAKALLEKVLEDNSNKSAQGCACFALAKLAEEKLTEGDKKAEKEAEKYLERTVKDFGDVKTRAGKLGDQAKGALFEMQNLAIGKKAPNVESKDLEGNKVQLKDYKGKVVVLDIWATWCPPCRAMIPHEREMVKKLKDKPFALISISADAEKKTLSDFIEKEPMPWTHWHNGAEGGILKDWNVRFFPTIYVLDGEGVIRYKNIRGKELEEAVEKLLAEAKDKK